MAHELLFTGTGDASIVYVGEIPWHGHGFREDGPLSATRAVELVGSDYEVTKEQNMAFRPDGACVPVAGHTLWCPPLPAYGIAEYQEFGQVGADYVPISTRAVAELLDARNDDGRAITDRWPVSTHGIISGGARVFFSLDAGAFSIAGRDVRQWVSIKDDKTGRGAFVVTVGGTRIVCRNTWELSASSANITAEIRHTGNAANEVRERLALIAQAQDAMARMADECRRMAGRALTDEDVATLLDRTYPAKRATRRFEIARGLEARGDKGGELFRRLYGADLGEYMAQREREEDKVLVCRAGVREEFARFNDDDQNEAHGSAWAFFNAVTGYTDHVQAVRGSAGSRALYKSFGDGGAAKTRAYDACVALN